MSTVTLTIRTERLVEAPTVDLLHVTTHDPENATVVTPAADVLTVAERAAPNLTINTSDEVLLG